MKNLSFFLLLLLLFSAKCDKDDDSSLNPIDALPPATQIGAQTFGCLINGVPFVPPVFGRNSPNAFYQFVRGAYTLGISGSTGGGTELQSILIGAIDVEAITERVYMLKEEESGKFHGEYLIGGGLDFSAATTTANPGILTITRFNEGNFIISGTFEFKVLDENGNEIKITEGRFDMNYTN